jgi:hypothetical protein
VHSFIHHTYAYMHAEAFRALCGSLDGAMTSRDLHVHMKRIMGDGKYYSFVFVYYLFIHLPIYIIYRCCLSIGWMRCMLLNECGRLNVDALYSRIHLQQTIIRRDRKCKIYTYISLYIYRMQITIVNP